MSKLGFVRPKVCRSWICHMQMILFILTALQSAFPGSWLLSLIPGIDWPPPALVVSAGISLDLVWGGWSHPFPCGILGLGVCAEALPCMEKPPWELLGCREVTRHSLTLSCRILLFLLLLPCWTPWCSNRFDFYFEVLYSSLKTLFNSCYPPLNEFLNVFFLFRPLSLAVTFL